MPYHKERLFTEWENKVKAFFTLGQLDQAV